MNAETWPRLVDLDLGETARIEGDFGAVTLQLGEVVERTRPVFVTGTTGLTPILDEALVTLFVNGEPVTLRHRPYEMPQEIGPLQMAVEALDSTARPGTIGEIPRLRKRVRLAVDACDESWGPAHLRFPLPDYDQGISTYRNTWGSLVPFNQLYYHRGEDYGAWPDRLPVIAALDGEVLAAPSEQARGSNRILLQCGPDAVLVYSHMNVGSLAPEVRPGAYLRAGQFMGLSGSTWNGREDAQYWDPHLHIGLCRATMQPADDPMPEARQSLHPALVYAFLRDTSHPVLAQAGGWTSTVPGQTITLDGGRSVTAPGQRIVSYQWRDAEGNLLANGPICHRHYARPGLYSEELRVRTAGGAEARDHARICVYDPTAPDQLPHGSFMRLPGCTPAEGQPVRFFQRLIHCEREVVVDFGDGRRKTFCEAHIDHVYRAPGLYTVTLRARSPARCPLVLQLPVFVV